MHRVAILGFLLLVGAAAAARAEVTRIDIHERRPYAEGRAIGDRGAWEVLRGTAHFAIDPQAPANAGIVDLPLAPRNARGKVEFQSDVEFWVPVDRSKASGAALYEVNNRGNKTAPNMFNAGADEFLLRQGIVMLWSGWIGEVLPVDGRLAFLPPPALVDGRPLRGTVRSEFVLDAPAEKASLAHRGFQGSFRPAADSLAQAKLTMRLNESDPRIDVPRDKWRFLISDSLTAGVAPVASDAPSKGVSTCRLPLVELTIDGGLKAGYIYEVVYEAEGGIVQGCGLAGIRDLISFLKYDATDKNPLRGPDGSPLVGRAHGFGTSQSGRCLRQFLYDGFNADEQGRKAFDGIMSHVAGGGLGSFNHRFASPTRTNGQHEEHTFAADFFPFTYGESTDPFTGQTDGILKKAIASKTAPRVFHTQSSSEYWHRSGSLVHTDPQGDTDSPLPAGVRAYTYGGTQHGTGSGMPSPAGSGQLPSNPADYRPLMRGLILALDAWVRDGIEPPPSVYPKIADRTLVDWREAASGWRPLPGVVYPNKIQTPAFLERGPDWLGKRIPTIEPPVVKGHYVVRVPGFDADDNEIGTLNLPFLTAPVATYTSWNLRSEKIGAPGELLGLQGAYIPLAKTKAAREATGDPRPALLERYRDFADYRQKFLAAAEKLVAARYLTSEELPRLAALAEKHRPLFAQ